MKKRLLVVVMSLAVALAGLSLGTVDVLAGENGADCCTEQPTPDPRTGLPPDNDYLR